MKAVLEFSYPEDEHKLKHAMKGTEMYVALVDVRRVVDAFHEEDNTTVAKVQSIISTIFKELEG